MAVTSKWVRSGAGTDWWTVPWRTSMTAPPTAVSLCMQCHPELASRKTCPGLRKVSIKRQTSTPCWLRKCSNSSFLPRNPSAFQRARGRALPCSVLLGRAAIFGHEQDNGLQDCPRAGCPCGKGRDGREQPTNQLHTCLQGKVIEEIRDILEWGNGRLCEYHQVGCCGFVSRGFDTRDFFLLGFYSRRLWGCCRFRLRLLRPGRLPGGCHFQLLRRHRDRLSSGILIWIWSSGLDDTPPSDDVVPPLTRVHLLDKGPNLLRFRSCRVACGGALSAKLRRLLCKSRLHLLPLNTAAVVPHVGAPTAAALRLFPQGMTSTRGGSPHTRGTVARIRSYTACVQNAGSVCIAMDLLEPC